MGPRYAARLCTSQISCTELLIAVGILWRERLRALCELRMFSLFVRNLLVGVTRLAVRVNFQNADMVVPCCSYGNPDWEVRAQNMYFYQACAEYVFAGVARRSERPQQHVDRDAPQDLARAQRNGNRPLRTSCDASSRYIL